MRNLIVVPVFNEEACLADTIASLKPIPESFDVLIVNDGSIDRTQEVAADLVGSASDQSLFIITHATNCGIGAAVQSGYRFAALKGEYEYVVQFDGDGQHDASGIAKLIDACERNGLDLCIGSRFLNEERVYRSPLLRRIGILFLSGLIRILTGIVITDPTSGFRCAGARAWRLFADRYPDDYPEPESVAWCLRHGLTVGEVSVRMHARKGGQSSIRDIGAVYYMTKVTLSVLIDRIRSNEAIQ